MTTLPADKILSLIAPLLEPMGYEAVNVEVHTHREKVLRVFIDRLTGTEGVGIEDCAAVSHALNEPLDAMPEVEAIFHGAYELEVSSPGIDRPLRHSRDYARFAGREARVYVLRPLTAEELGNAEYHAKHPKQKSFLGVIRGVGPQERVLLNLVPDHGGDGFEKPKPGQGKSKKKAASTNSVAEVSIPLPLITKANLTPKLDFDGPVAAESEY